MRRFAAIASLCLLVGLAACGNTQPPATGVGAAIAAAQAPASGVAAPSQQSLASLLTQLQTNSAADIANAIGIDMSELPATADRVMEALVERRRRRRLGDARREAS